MNKTLNVTKCAKCGKDARWNTPGQTPEGKVYCNTCTREDRSGIMFVGMDWKDGDYYPGKGVSFNGVVVWADRSTWTEGGSRSVHLTPEEKALSVEDIARMLHEEHNVQGLYRCTGKGCNAKMKESDVAGWPLFAGCNCASCWGKHQQSLKDEVARGHVCGMCGKAYGACYC